MEHKVREDVLLSINKDRVCVANGRNSKILEYICAPIHKYRAINLRIISTGESVGSIRIPYLYFRRREQ